MRYIMMMHAPRGDGGYGIDTWPPDAFQRHIDFMMALNAELQASGELVGAEGLAPPSEARVVRAGDDGPVVTDGPFAETKEFLAGYWMIDVPSAARAYEIAAHASSAPGADGSPMHLAIEVRQVLSAPEA
jgi:hypothetical protein